MRRPGEGPPTSPFWYAWVLFGGTIGYFSASYLEDKFHVYDRFFDLLSSLGIPNEFFRVPFSMAWEAVGPSLGAIVFALIYYAVAAVVRKRS